MGTRLNCFDGTVASVRAASGGNSRPECTGEVAAPLAQPVPLCRGRGGELFLFVVAEEGAHGAADGFEAL